MQRATRLLQGEISCRSRLGRGTVFDLDLPRAVFADDQLYRDEIDDRETSPRLPGLVGRRVCIVEDESSIRESLSWLLQSWGIEVLAFPDAASALDSGAPINADYVITDFRLPVASMDLRCCAKSSDARAGKFGVCC